MTKIKNSLATGEAAAVVRSFTDTAINTIDVHREAVAGSNTLAHGIPQMIPRGELIFWTPEWRALEAESLRELNERAEPREFPNFRQLARWLLSADEE